MLLSHEILFSDRLYDIETRSWQRFTCPDGKKSTTVLDAAEISPRAAADSLADCVDCAYAELTHAAWEESE